MGFVVKSDAMKYQYIAVEGPIGVGKTTLAKKLSGAIGGRYLPDSDTVNPYLKTFYQNPQRVAFHTQMHFLVSRLEAMEASRIDSESRPVVADFMFDKDRLFAELTLDEIEWQMYSAIYDRSTRDVVKPDLVVYLQAPLERLVQRIERRGLKHEQRMESRYLQRLIELYERFFHQYDASPLLIVNAAEINLADSPEDFDSLVERIRSVEGGRHYVNPIASISS